MNFITGTASSDKIDGTSGPDYIQGGYGNDVISGGDGNDEINGQADNDVLTGGPGKDVFLFNFGFSYGSDVITDFKRGEDVIDVRGTGLKTRTFSEVIAAAVTVAGDAVLTFAPSYTVRLSGVPLSSLKASDFLFPLTATGTSGDDTFELTWGADVVSGGAGNDVIANIFRYGPNPNDFFYNGTLGEDELRGESGDDIIGFTLDAKLVDGGEGNDTAYQTFQNLGAKVIYSLGEGGQPGRAASVRLVSIENLYTGNSDDTIVGSDANNAISSSLGSDRIDGGFGTDLLTGGPGGDTFIGLFRSSGNTIDGDFITDLFKEDRISLEFAAGISRSFRTLSSADLSFADGVLTVGNGAGSVLVRVNLPNASIESSFELRDLGERIEIFRTDGAGVRRDVGSDGVVSLVGGVGPDRFDIVEINYLNPGATQRPPTLTHVRQFNPAEGDRIHIGWVVDFSKITQILSSAKTMGGGIRVKLTDAADLQIDGLTPASLSASVFSFGTTRTVNDPAAAFLGGDLQAFAVTKRWVPGQLLGYSFDSDLSPDAVATARKTYEQIARVANLDFREERDGQLYHLFNPDLQGAAAVATFPTPTGASVKYGSSRPTASTVIHEILHTMGLNHADESPGFRALLHGLPYTAMGSTSIRVADNASNLYVFHQLTGPLALDLEALIQFYGDSQATLGDDFYLFDTSTFYFEGIHDSGGRDTVVIVDSQRLGVKLDLRERGGFDLGSISAAGTRLPSVFQTKFTKIEDVKLGDGPDSIIGNDANNLIVAAGGSDVLTGNGGDDRIEGGAGRDIATYRGPRDSYKVSSSGQEWLIEDKVGLDGRDSLTGVERLLFQSSALALDIDGDAGKLALFIGAVFGKGAVSDQRLVGIGLRELDAGTSDNTLMEAAITGKVGASPSYRQVVDLLYGNIVGGIPSNEDAKYFVELLETGIYSIGSLGVWAASTDLNRVNVDLVGLTQTGLAYLVDGI
jgi:Ca2+-binding RTX toxin-like protein